MSEITCPYKPCGENENCVGCVYDPENRPMDFEMFRDHNTHLGCGDCKFCDPKGDLDGVVSPCKRLDHKKYKFAMPWFKSYDCGQRNGSICGNFEPKEWKLWLARHWKPEYINEYRKLCHGTIGLVIDGITKIRYYVSALDFFENTFMNKDGTLKWTKRMYYIKSRSSPIGYELIREFPDGRKVNHD